MARDAPFKRGALEQLSASHLNCVPATSSKKRKRLDGDTNDRYLQSFTATLLSEADSKSTYTLFPIAWLDRSHMRLSHLHFDRVEGSLPSGCSFRSDIFIFNNSPDVRDPELLLARLAPNGELYFIEKVESGIFVACRLRSWVKEGHFQAGVRGIVDCSLSIPTSASGNGYGTFDPPSPKRGLAQASPVAKLSPKRPKNRKGVLARISILPKTELQDQSMLGTQHEAVGETDTSALLCQMEGDLSVDISATSSLARNKSDAGVCEPQSRPAHMHDVKRDEPNSASSRSPDDPFGAHCRALFEALYVSKTALAHFTKSILARIRATSRSSTTTGISALAEFYRTRLIPSKKMDLKYRDTIPKIIENMVFLESPDKRVKILPVLERRKRSVRRKKLGKDGLHSDEANFVQTWWLNREDRKVELWSASSRESEKRALLAELRNRETQLQIILILEILTLESTTPVLDEGPAAVNQGPDDNTSSMVLAQTPLVTTKKRDLRPDLDILVDRLCIYQSVCVTNPNVAQDTKEENGESGKEVKDKLRDFCCNVILPFYLHKAAEVVRDISRKLGGPDLSPKRRLNHSDAILSRPKPGMAVGTRRGSIPRRTLERVLGEEQNSRASSPPTLMRSATAPSGGPLIRGSADNTLRPGSRGSLQRSHSFTNREVDLVASTKAHNAKQKKLADLAKQKQELDAAICALKKPNRSLVGMEIMSEVENRSADGNTTGKGSLRRSTSIQNPGIQITATPKRVKSRKLDHTEGWQAKDLDEQAIPSSAVRNSDHRSHHPISINTTQASTPRQAIHETPSRSSLRKTSNPVNLPNSTTTTSTITTSPPPPSLHTVHSTPHTNRQSHFLPLPPDSYLNPHPHLSTIPHTPSSHSLRMTKSSRPVLFTALQRADVEIESAFRDAPVVSERVGRAMDRVMGTGDRSTGGEGAEGKSVYQALGWDEDEDDGVDELVGF